MRTHFRVLQGQFNRGFQKAFFAAAVIAFSFVLEGIHVLMLHQSGNSIGKLDLATHATGLLANLVKHTWREDVPARYAHA